jgi:uncharacterized LabA/DUF88 family protein
MSAKMGIFVDISNIYYCVGKRFSRKVNYEKYLQVAVGENTVFRAYAYGAQYGTEANRFLDCLRGFGYTPRYKKPKEFDNPDYKIDLEIFDAAYERIRSIIEVAGIEPPPLDFDLQRMKESMEAVKRVLRGKKDIRKADWDVGLAIDVVRIVDRVDQVVIGSADGDLAPLVEWVKEQGCRCIVFACNISRELRDVADEVIEIDDALLEVR